MGDDTYAPVNFLRPELGNAPPTGAWATCRHRFSISEVVQEPAQLGGGMDTVSSNYAANREAHQRARRRRPTSRECQTSMPEGHRAGSRRSEEAAARAAGHSEQRGCRRRPGRPG